MTSGQPAHTWPAAPFGGIEETDIAALRAALADRQCTVRDLTEQYLARIEAMNLRGPALRAVLEINPEALDIAGALDQELAASKSRGPLHGIPVLLKDNIATADRMQTTAGSLALVGSVPKRDATVARQLREAGAVILGKCNLSEWANFRSTASASGWSVRGGQTLNPYALDCSPGGSSSGSAVAVAASLCAASVGTETDGSIICPAAASGVVGIKPTVGLTSRTGVIPIAHSQDTVGPFGRSVADAALLLGALAGTDPRDTLHTAPAMPPGVERPTDYTQFLDPDGLRGARIGIPRVVYFGYSAEADAITEAAIVALRDAGAEIIDPADIPTAREIADGSREFDVLLYEFKANIAAYLAGWGPDSPLRSLADLIRFNEEHTEREMPYFRQEIFLQAEAKGPLTEPAYRDALATNHRLSRRDGIDAVLDRHQLDALVAPSGGPAWKIDLINGDHPSGSSSQPAAMAGYPLISVPAGCSFGLPVNITFMGRAFSEPTLIRLAYAFEQATHARWPPPYAPPSVIPGGSSARCRGSDGPPSSS